MQNFSVPFREQVGPDVLGICWITRKALEERPFPFLDIDYLLDGLLTYHLRRTGQNEGSTQPQRHNFFMSHNFGRPFFVAHIHATGQALKKDFASLMQLLPEHDKKKKSQNAANEKIIILLEKDQQDLPEINSLKKTYPEKRFEVIYV